MTAHGGFAAQRCAPVPSLDNTFRYTRSRWAWAPAGGDGMGEPLTLLQGFIEEQRALGIRAYLVDVASLAR